VSQDLKTVNEKVVAYTFGRHGIVCV